MKFGVREICDVVFKANQNGYLGSMQVKKGQPVLYIDSAKTSSMEGSATTVYAQGGKGNSRLLAWEGEKALTFTVEDALLSPIGFAMLSGAGFFKPAANQKAFVHTSQIASLGTDNKTVIVELRKNEEIAPNAPVFVMGYASGSIVGTVLQGTVGTASTTGERTTQTITLKEAVAENAGFSEVFVDFYVARATGVTELTIDAANFGGYYYVEASTLFKREDSGKDMPAELVFPKVKIQSNFTFNMSSTGDPSTFSFVMDAFPDYTMFNRTKKVLCAIQIIEDEIEREGEEAVTFMGTNESVIDDILGGDSNTSVPSAG